MVKIIDELTKYADIMNEEDEKYLENCDLTQNDTYLLIESL